ncbi:membrane-bound metal-dependent hydrolase [Paenibacillus curdlanolyticus YK9]|uniref:Membrane-bound metal-dependent hydrolase n=1 Tax=Paenibacillus curdlanolyticus YK9 TaxID=717606 RepID=E0I920_9BACL|nr:metal-dependent hydrolase [Paenibacillus curdlanolyticus]EFM10904.1 membrane-bound metal-dependent hydrolase [Paenibacillus curdlanolyticus YK9]
MKGSSHLVISTGVSLAVTALLHTSLTPAAAAAAVVGSLLPDLDEPNGLLANRTFPKPAIRALQIVLLLAAAAAVWFTRTQYPWNWGAGAVISLSAFASTRWLRQLLMLITGGALTIGGVLYDPRFAAAGLTLVVCALVPHRGFTHTLYATGLWTFALYWMAKDNPGVWLAGGLSYLLHLLADALSKRGVQLLPPLPWKLCIPLMRSGKSSAAVVETAAIGLTFILLWIVFVQMGQWRLWTLAP